MITFLSVSALYGVVMARALIEEATEILVENAIARGTTLEEKSSVSFTN